MESNGVNPRWIHIGPNIFGYVYEGSLDENEKPTVRPIFESEYADYNNHCMVNGSENGDGTVTVNIMATSFGSDIGFDSDSIYYDSTYLPSNISFEGLDTITKVMFYDDMKSGVSNSGEPWNIGSFTDMSNMFNGCTNLTTIEGLQYLDTSNVTNMSNMFAKCDKLTTVEGLSNWDTSKVTDMSYMFLDCKELSTIDLSNWDTGSCTTLRSFFNGCLKLTHADLSNFNVSKATNIGNMFYNCGELLSVEGLSRWNTSNVDSIDGMFYNCAKITSLDLNNWDISNVSNTDNMLTGCNNLTQVSMTNNNIASINIIIDALPTRTTDSYGTLLIIKSDDSVNRSTANSKYWNVYLPIAEYSFTSSIDTLPIFNEGYEYTKVDSIIGSRTIRTILSDDVPTSINFIDKTGLLSLDRLNTINITSMENMFYGCINLVSVNTKDWTTDKVSNMHGMFANCSSLRTVDLSNFNTSNVTNMNGLFYNCGSLRTLDLSNFDTSKVTDMSYMLEECINLVSIDISNFKIKGSAICDNMFYNLKNLRSIKANNCDPITINAIIIEVPNNTSNKKNIIYNLNGKGDYSKVFTKHSESKNWKVCIRRGYNKNNIIIGEIYL